MKTVRVILGVDGQQRLKKEGSKLRKGRSVD